MAKAKKDKKNGGGAHKAEAELRGHERPGGVERARFTEQLPCKLEGDEVADLRSKLVAVTIERVGKEAEAAALKTEIKALGEREDSLVEQLADEAELRDVECVEVLYVETNAVDTIRQDTGEVVRTRTATAEDLQEDLDAAIAKRVVDEAIGKPGKPPAGDGEDDDFLGGAPA